MYLTGPPLVVSKVATCNRVRNTGGHAEYNPRPQKAGSALITPSDHWRQYFYNLFVYLLLLVGLCAYV